MVRCAVVHAPTDSEPFVVLDKPGGLPSAPLEAGGESALSEAAGLFPQVLSVRGRKEVEGGLVHRLDTATSGLVLVAASQEFFDLVQAEQAAGRFLKSYRAAVDKIPDCAAMLGGFPPVPQVPAGGRFSVESAFRPFGPRGAAVRPVAAGSGRAAARKGGSRLYETEISVSGGSAECAISAGYRHQVRCHLAWCGLPVRGDPLYNPVPGGGGLGFRAVGLDFAGFSFRAP